MNDPSYCSCETEKFDEVLPIVYASIYTLYLLMPSGAGEYIFLEKLFKLIYALINISSTIVYMIVYEIYDDDYNIHLFV